MGVLAVFFQTARQHNRSGILFAFRHWGAFGLFALAILDSSPLPTFAGPDILTAILAASHRNPWYEYAAMATAGSVIGAFITFRLARSAGAAYLHRKFGKGRVAALLKVFQKRGTTALAISTAVPFPFPTSALFAAAGASGYGTRKYLAVVGLCRAVRYSLVAVLADLYGRHFIRAIRHPGRYWGWLLLCGAIVAAAIVAGKFVRRRLDLAADASESYSAPALSGGTP
jgi:membrane protein YqaA with SNARE-associated domain